MKPAEHQAKAANPAEALAAGAGLAKSKRGQAAAGGVRAWLRRRSFALWLTALVLAVGATQIRSLEQEQFNDESTALVLAGHLLDGNLPYVQLFDNKPPLLFLLLAGAMALFGESLLVVRALGDFFLLLSAVAVFAIARRRTGPAAAGLGALLLVAIHAKGPGTATMAALPATALLLAALWLLLAWRQRLWGVAAAGLLLSLATLTRSNLGFLVLACSLWLGLAPLRPSLGVPWRAVPVFAAAGLAPLGLLVVVYWRADALEALYLANVTVPLAFASAMGAAQVLWGLLGYMRWEIWAAPQLFLPFAAAFAAGLAAAVPRLASVRRCLGRFLPVRQPAEGAEALGQSGGTDQAERELPWLALLATLASVLMSGAAYLHYWLQLYPICAVFCAYGIAWMHSRPVLRWAGYLLPALALAGAVAKAAPAAVRLVAAPGHPYAQHGLRAAAEAMSQEIGRQDTIYAFAGQLIYWYLDMRPVSVVVHPSNLGNPGIMRPLAEAGRVGEDELGRILALRPTWLVVPAAPQAGVLIPHYFDDRNAALLRRLLANEYLVFHDGGAAGRGFKVYQRRERRGRPA